jgi:hypothetical protein
VGSGLNVWVADKSQTGSWLRKLKPRIEEYIVSLVPVEVSDT